MLQVLERSGKARPVGVEPAAHEVAPSAEEPSDAAAACNGCRTAVVIVVDVHRLQVNSLGADAAETRLTRQHPLDVVTT